MQVSKKRSNNTSHRVYQKHKDLNEMLRESRGFSSHLKLTL